MEDFTDIWVTVKVSERALSANIASFFVISQCWLLCCLFLQSHIFITSAYYDAHFWKVAWWHVVAVLAVKAKAVWYEFKTILGYQDPVSKHQKRKKKLLKLQLHGRSVACYTQDSRFNPQVVPHPQINPNKNIREHPSPFDWVHTPCKPVVEHSGRRQRQEDRNKFQASQHYIV